MSPVLTKQQSSDSPIVALDPHVGVYKDMHWILTLFILFSGPAFAGSCEAPENCGVESTVIPDFTLTDLNPASATYGQDRSRDEFLGSVLVVYFAQAT